MCDYCGRADVREGFHGWECSGCGAPRRRQMPEWYPAVPELQVEIRKHFPYQSFAQFNRAVGLYDQGPIISRDLESLLASYKAALGRSTIPSVIVALDDEGNELRFHYWRIAK